MSFWSGRLSCSDMNDMDDFVITTEWIDGLLALTTVEEQAAHVRAAGLLDEAGLSTLLDETEGLMRQDPSQARLLAEICAALADLALAPALVPRATYLRAQTHVINGEFVYARELIERARSGYAQLGLRFEALRTNVGLMSVLAESGHFQDMLDVGQSVLAQIAQDSAAFGGADSADLRLLTALIYGNLSTALGEMGRYQASIDACTNAEVIFESLKMPDYLAQTINNRGVTLRYLGHIREALAAYERAALIQSALGQSALGQPNGGYLHAVTLYNMGDAQLLLGNYSQSLNTLEEARQQLAALGAVVDEQSCTLHMADAYLSLNLYAEALAAYQDAESALSRTDEVYQHGLALWGMGATHTALADFQQADSCLARALSVFQTIDNVPLRATVLLEQAALQSAQGEQKIALVTVGEALELVSARTGSETQWPVQAVYAHMRMADLLLPDIAAAEAHLLSAEQFSQSLTLPHLRYRLDQRLGHLRLRQDRVPEAQQLLEASINGIEQLRSTLTHEAMRTSFLHDKMAAYSNLVQLHLDYAATQLADPSGPVEPGDQDRLQQAFNVIERAKSRALVELITGTVEARLDAASDLEAPDTKAVARLRALQAELNAVYDELLRDSEGSSDQSDSAGDTARRVPTLQTRTTELEQEITRLRLRTEGQANGADLFAQPLTLLEIQAQVPTDLILLTYHILDDEIIAFVITANETQLVRHVSRMCIVQPLLQQFSSQREPFRGGSAFVERHMDTLERTTRQLLASLYDALIAPIAPLLANAVNATGVPIHKLAVVPHGLLHHVPFHALYDGEGYLLERFEISYAPSATVFTLAQRHTISSTGAALVVGVAEPGIPAVEAELSAVAQELANATVLLNEEATHDALFALMRDRRVLHLACHGLFRTDNPLFSALKLFDSWLTGIDIAQLDLTGALVVLSACESGRGQVLGGDEIIGLVRACLGAGASSLIVSQWLVQDDATAILMVEFYMHLARGVAPAAALRAAQLALKSSHPHPYYWAPFVLIGSRAGFVEKTSCEE